MRAKILYPVFLLLLTASCVSIPKETVVLSQTIGTDLQALHEFHRNAVRLYYQNLKTSIESFVNEVYAPFAIRRVLASELDLYKSGRPSLYGAVENMGKTGKEQQTMEALEMMAGFQEAANDDISLKKSELLAPVQEQERNLLNAIDQSYRNILYANTTLTAYLSSARKVKEAQEQALSVIGMKETANSITGKLVEMSDLVNAATLKAKKIDLQSDRAGEQIQAIVHEIKELTQFTKK